jgi:hypothetical protein
MVLVHAHSYTGTCFVNLLLFEKFCHMVFTSYNSFISQILETGNPSQIHNGESNNNLETDSDN